MRKKVVYVMMTDNRQCNLNFRYRDEKGRDYILFVRKYDKLVYRYFKDGKSLDQLHRDTSWHGNRKLCKLVEERIPSAIKAVEKGGCYAAGAFGCIY